MQIMVHAGDEESRPAVRFCTPTTLKPASPPKTARRVGDILISAIRRVMGQGGPPLEWFRRSRDGEVLRRVLRFL